MDVEDILFYTPCDLELKMAVLRLCHEHRLTGGTPVLIPTDSNDDLTGSQHAAGGGTDFTYRDAEVADLENVSSLGHYEYFSVYGYGYTGHYYQGDGKHFEALVLNPPAYAAEEHV